MAWLKAKPMTHCQTATLAETPCHRIHRFTYLDAVLAEILGPVTSGSEASLYLHPAQSTAGFSIVKVRNRTRSSFRENETPFHGIRLR